jgi:hypothetical protein
MTWTLWEWLPRRDEWVWMAEGPDDPERRRVLLRGYRKRAPRGTTFRWRNEDGPPRKIHRRAAKTMEDA